MTVDEQAKARNVAVPTAGSAFDGVGGLGRAATRVSGRWGQKTAAVLVTVAAAVGAGYLYNAKGETTEVLVVSKAVAPGEVVERSDLSTAQVSGVSGAVSMAEIDTVVGKRAVTGLVEGQVLTDALVTSSPVPGEKERLVAVRLPAGRVPAGLGAGAVVNVLAVPAEGADGVDEELDAPVELAKGAGVHAVSTAVDGSLVVSLLLGAGEADQVAAYSSAGRVTVVQTPVGED